VTRAVLAAAVLTCLAAAACAINPATGKRQLSLVSQSDEVAMGREADQEIVASLGLYPDDALQRYVQEVGQRLAAVSERPDLKWTFRVVDDPTVNAFALPGGFLYVTRGILAYLTSEAELAAVLGHEIGHVTARHSVTQMSQAQLAQLGLGLGVALGGDVGRELGWLASQGVGLLFLKFSRDDERQADDLGLRYLVGAGYDARPLPGVYEMLRRVGESSGSERVPGWLSTHPAPENRKARLESSIAGLGQDFSGRPIGRSPYHVRIDGIVFGDDPREGYFVEPNRFLHPGLAFQLDFPAGWKARNEKRRVAAASPEQDGVVQLSLADHKTPDEALAAFLKQSGVRPTGAWLARVGDIAVVSREFAFTSGQDELLGLIAFFSYDQRVLGLLGYATAAAWPNSRTTIGAALGSFRRLTDEKALAVEPWRIGVVTPATSLSVPEFSRRFGATVPLANLARINQVLESDLLSPGTEYKIVRGGRRP